MTLTAMLTGTPIKPARLMTEIPVVAVDGPSGSGKGVVCQHLAVALGFHILDSGSLYRLVGLAARREGIDLAAESADNNKVGDHEAALAALAASLDIAFQLTNDPEDPLIVRLNQRDVTRELRSDEAGVDASRVAHLAGVRRSLMSRQRAFRRAPGLIADGRDMGTVVFPDAGVKVFLTASAEARAERRYNQLKHKGIDVSLHALLQSIKDRDERDIHREVSPLRPAEDATVIDSTHLDVDEVLSQVLAIVAEKLDLTSRAGPGANYHGDNRDPGPKL